MHRVHDAVLFPEMNREHTTMMTTLRSHAISSCDVAAIDPSLDDPPSDPADGEDHDQVSTVVVPETELACDFFGSVLSFDRSRARQVADAVFVPKCNRECTAALTTPSPIAHSCCDVAATYPNLCGHPKATGSEPTWVEEDDPV